MNEGWIDGPYCAKLGADKVSVVIGQAAQKHEDGDMSSCDCGSHFDHWPV